MEDPAVTEQPDNEQRREIKQRAERGQGTGR